MQDGNYVESHGTGPKNSIGKTVVNYQFLFKEIQFITLGKEIVYTGASTGTARVVNTLMEDNQYFNHKCMDTFIFEKNMAIGYEMQMIKILNESWVPFLNTGNNQQLLLTNDVYKKLY